MITRVVESSRSSIDMVGELVGWRVGGWKRKVGASVGACFFCIICCWVWFGVSVFLFRSYVESQRERKK